MKKKTVPTKAEPVKNPEILTLNMDIDDKRTRAEFVADELLRGGGVSNALLIKHFHLICAELDLDACVRTLKATAKQVTDGDNSDLEGMLSAQAMALNSVFTNLARRANDTNHMQQLETFMRLALKAQNQCRATIDTLAQIKHPRQTVFARQANIANGHQQVNNTLNQGTEQQPLSLKNSEIAQNKLLSHEQEKGERLDSGKAGAASGDHQAMATLGKVNRANNRRRESQSST